MQIVDSVKISDASVQGNRIVQLFSLFRIQG